MSYFFNLVFYHPILNLLVYFYETVAARNFGFAIIFVTIVVRLILYPFFHKGARQQMLMQRIQPEVRKIQELHKNDREKQTQALMALYKQHGVSPFSSILLLIIQIPIMLALFYAVQAPSHGAISGLYSYIPQPGAVNTGFFGINLTAPSLVLILCAAIAQYFQARLAIYKNPAPGAKPSQAEKMARQMSFIGPIFTLIVFYRLPAAIGLYWFATSAFSVFQQIIVNRHFKRGETAAI